VAASSDPTPGSGLSLRGVTKTWGSEPTLAGVDMAVARGEVARISGGNGAGKTTLLRIAAGLLVPEGGEVTVDGNGPETSRRGYVGRLGFLSAGDRGLYPRLSPLRHLSLCASLALMERARRREAVASAVEAFGIGAFADRQSQRLSLGQRQRVRLAMAFLHDPALVLLDEPATSLDADGLGRLSAAVERARAAGACLVWSAPSTAEPDLPHDTAYVLQAGALVSA
jgi:ABC-type multidrug transport system ATPase subunit